MGNGSRLTLGTSSPIRVPKPKATTIETAGDGYFQLKIHSAQATVFGGFLDRPKQLVVTSEVRLNHAPFGADPLKAIHRVRPLQKGVAEQLGLATTLIGLTPATTDHVTIAIEYLLDQKNSLASLAGLINDDAFQSVVGFGGGPAALAGHIARLSTKVLDTILDHEDRRPLLRFWGDLQLSAGDFTDAYYVIIGTTYDKAPLPERLPDASMLEVRGPALLLNGEPVKDWSYVVLDMDIVEVRGRALGRGEPWYERLDDVEAKASVIANDPFAKEKQKRAAWNECSNLLREADILLRRDPRYTSTDAKEIIKKVAAEAKAQILGTATGLGAAPTLPPSELEFLGVSSEQQLQVDVAAYTVAEASSTQKLTALGLLS